MNKSRFLRVLVGACLFFVGGCVRPNELHYPEPEGKITVEGDKIYLNEMPYAELLYHGSYLKNQRHIGLAIYYYPYDKEEWIFPKSGWAYYVLEEKKKYSTIAEMKELKRTAKERGLTYRSFITGLDVLDSDKVYLMLGDKKFIPIEKSPTPNAFDIQIAEDGKYICYKVKDLWTSSYQYRVKYSECFERDSGTSRRR